MDQIQLMQIAERLKPGQAIEINREDMRECAKGNLSSLLFDSVRPSDVIAFAADISLNWGVKMTLNHLDGSYTMYKPLQKRREKEWFKTTVAPT